MTDLRKAAEMALDALDEINKLSVGEKAICLPAEIDDAMEALRQALAQPEQEPVAWLEPEWQEKICPEFGYEVTITDDHPRDLCWIPLYTAPPKREWVGLTEEELEPLCDLWKVSYGSVYVDEFARAIEAKLKEKNA